MEKKILITGGAGFIGSQLTNHLASCGWKIFVVDKLLNDTSHYIQEQEVELLEIDISDTDRYRDILNEVDNVVHLAAAGNVVQSIQDPMDNYKNNVEGTLKLLEAIRLSRCKRIIFSSTGGALMGNADPPISELTVPNPISPYGASKLACEAYIRAYSASYSLDFNIFRFGNVIGPNSTHKLGVVQKFFNAIQNNDNLEIYGDVSRDFIFSGDLVNIIFDCLSEKLPQNETILLATGNETKIADLAGMILDFFPDTCSRITEQPRRVGEVGKNYANIEKFNLLRPNYNFMDLRMALDITLDYLLSSK